jgi:hypothetical protein
MQNFQRVLKDDDLAFKQIPVNGNDIVDRDNNTASHEDCALVLINLFL